MPLGRPGFARDGGLAKADTSPEAKGFAGAGRRGWKEAVVVPLGIFQPLRPGGTAAGMELRFPAGQIWESFGSERIASSPGAPHRPRGVQNPTGIGWLSGGGR